MYLTGKDIIRAEEIIDNVCSDEKEVKFISGATTSVVGGIITAKSGSLEAGIITKALLDGTAKAHEKDVAEVVTSAYAYTVTTGNPTTGIAMALSRIWGKL